MCNIQLFLLAVSLPWSLCSGTNCGWPGFPRHGLLNGSSDEVHELVNTHGTKVRYSCQGEGRKLFGSEVRECVNGRWSEALPWCASNIIRDKKVAIEIHSSHSDEPTLISPPEITDGITTDSDKSPCMLLSGNEKHIFHFMDFKEYVIHRILFYTKDPFPVMKNTWEVHTPSKWLYNVTSKTVSPAITVENEGLETIDELSIGIESEVSFEICEVEIYAKTERLECGSPEVPLHALVELSGDEQFASYSCKTAYQIDGPAQRTCNGISWTGVPPTCFPIKSHQPKVNETPTERPSMSSTQRSESTDHVNGIADAEMYPPSTKVFDGGNSDLTLVVMAQQLVMLFGILICMTVLAALVFGCWMLYRRFRKKEAPSYEPVNDLQA